MRVVFGVVSLLLALVIVAALAKTQVQALGGSSMRVSGDAARAGAETSARTPAGAAAPGGRAPGEGTATTRSSTGTAQRVGDAAVGALQRGADRGADESQ